MDIGKGFLTELRFLFSFLSSRLENHRLIILSSSTTQISLSILWYSLFSCTHFSIFLHSSDAILCQSLRARAITFFSFAFIRLFRPFKPCLPVTFITTSFSTTLFRKTLYYRLAKFYHFKVNFVNISPPIGPQKESRISCYNFRRRKFLYLGHPRNSKSPDLFINLSKYVSTKDLPLKSFHVSNSSACFDPELVDFLRPQESLLDFTRSSDIVFCAYNDNAYLFSESATFLDAVSASAFILVTKSFSLSCSLHALRVIFVSFSRLSRFPHPMFDKALCYSLQSAFKGVFIGH